MPIHGGLAIFDERKYWGNLMEERRRSSGFAVTAIKEESGS